MFLSIQGDQLMINTALDNTVGVIVFDDIIILLWDI